MKNFDLYNLLYYCLFSMFHFYQTLHLKNYNGESRTFFYVLRTSEMLFTITTYVYLIYYGIEVSWLAAGLLFIISIAFMLIGGTIERLTGAFVLSFLAFIACPILAYFMFTTIPSSSF